MPYWAEGGAAGAGDGDWGSLWVWVVRSCGAYAMEGSTLLWEGPLSAFLVPTHGEQAGQQT